MRTTAPGRQALTSRNCRKGLSLAHPPASCICAAPLAPCAVPAGAPRPQSAGAGPRSRRSPSRPRRPPRCTKTTWPAAPTTAPVQAERQDPMGADGARGHGVTASGSDCSARQSDGCRRGWAAGAEVRRGACSGTAGGWACACEAPACSRARPHAPSALRSSSSEAQCIICTQPSEDHRAIRVTVPVPPARPPACQIVCDRGAGAGVRSPRRPAPRAARTACSPCSRGSQSAQRTRPVQSAQQTGFRPSRGRHRPAARARRGRGGGAERAAAAAAGRQCCAFAPLGRTCGRSGSRCMSSSTR
jgi:hypothetical protein